MVPALLLVCGPVCPAGAARYGRGCLTQSALSRLSAPTVAAAAKTSKITTSTRSAIAIRSLLCLTPRGAITKLVFGHYTTMLGVRGPVEFAHYLESPISLAVDLVNSFSPVSRREDLVDSAALASFLWEHQVSHEDPPTNEDLDQVRQIRARLREVFQAEDHETAARLVNRLLTESRASPQLTNHDANPWHLHYTPPQTPLGPRLAANAAVALALVIAEAGFDRLRVCEGERCKDVFVDRSRNRSRRYCSPQVCGNRASVAAYRARQRGTSPRHRGDPDRQDRPHRTA